MKRAAATMLAAVFANATKGEFINLRRIHPDTPAVEEFIGAGDIGAAANWAVDRRDAGNVYVGVLPRARRAGGRDAISCGWAVWVDCDSPESVLALAQFPLEPSIEVLSGTDDNRHAYWLLSEAADLVTIERLNKQIASALGGDPVVCDAARVLRVPGTMNHKHDPPTEVVLHSCSGSRYTVADVERVLESDEVVSERSKAVDATPATGDSPTERLLARLNNVRPNANGWMASCPAHDDRNPSLTIAEGEDGRCLINCFAGCSPDAIVAAVGLRMADLYRRDDEPDESPSVSGQLVAIAIKAGIRPFHDSAHVAYAWVPVGGHQEAWALKSRRFERWLRFELYRQSKLTPGAEAVKAAVEMLSARADFDAPEDEVELRSAWCDLGLAYDLADSDGRAVIVTPTGWSVRTQSQVPFVRRDSVLALPVPAEKGDIELLRHYVNVASNEEFVLLVAWLVMALRPNGPYPVLVIVGPQGSAKSTQTRMHKQLVDPVKAPLRSLPGSLRDLAIAARSSHVLAFDNVSKLTDVMSDGFCRLATGDGFATRELYSDDEEVIFEHTRALILNGIDAIVTRQDLLGRAIVVRLAPIPDTNRLDEDTLWSRFDQDRARIFGGLLDGAVSALANWDSTPAAGFRMADFARWSAAAMPAFGWGPDEFYRAYRENLSGALKASLEGSILATVVMRLLDQPATPAIDGTPAAVWRQLSAKLSDEERQSGGFPKNAQAMSAQLTRLSPALGEVGVSVENTTQGSGDSKERRIVIRRLKDSGTHGTHGTQPQHSTSNPE